MRKNSNRPSSYKKLSYVQKISMINRKLRVGDISRISEETGYSAPHVYEVVSGTYVNERLVNLLYDLTRGRMPNYRRIESLAKN
jgi:hypothetical protein